MPWYQRTKISRYLHEDMLGETTCRYEPSTFLQATLPVKLGGLGIRRSEDICLPAFRTSSNKCAEIVNQLFFSYRHKTQLILTSCYRKLSLLGKIWTRV